MPRLSIIIPNYNDSETLPACLESVLASDYKDFETILVDDKSTDNSAQLAEGFGVTVMRHDKNRGQGAARNTGARLAAGEILVFVDADVCLKRDTLKRIAETFSAKGDIAAVVGITEDKVVYENLPSIHFTRRVHFNYLKLPPCIDIMNCTMSAVKKDVFFKLGGFNEAITGVEDSEMGGRMAGAGYKILHDKGLNVLHRKRIGLVDLFRNDFRRTVDRVKLLMGRRMVKGMIRDKKFLSTPVGQLLSPFVSFGFFAFLMGGVFYRPLAAFSLVFLATFIFLNAEYIAYNYRKKGLLFSVKIALLMLVDMLIVSFGLAWGTILFLKGQKY